MIVAAIRTEGLYKIFGRRADEALRRLRDGATSEEVASLGVTAAVIDVTFEVRPGEIFVVMGLSGSGKSTLIRMLNGLLPATAGHVYVGDDDVAGLGDAALRELRRDRMSMVFQHFALLPHRTVLENAAYPLKVRGMSKQDRAQKGHEALEMVGLKGWEDKLPHELSGGMRQRVGLARALAAETEIMLMDEAFSALDPLIRREMQDEFLRLQSMLQKTIVFITHDFDEAIRLADRIAIMKDGVIVQIGTPEDLVTRPATAYVAEFTQDVSRAKVLSVRSVMVAGAAEGAVAGELPATARIEEIAHRVVKAERPFAVVDERGQRIGQLDRESVLEVLAPGGREGPKASSDGDKAGAVP